MSPLLLLRLLSMSKKQQLEMHSPIIRHNPEVKQPVGLDGIMLNEEVKSAAPIQVALAGCTIKLGLSVLLAHGHCRCYIGIAGDWAA